nr:MAG TPA: hypothetical protein [Caudoviricetes sp.]DAT36786.1 MAG TPA: hypothetical protein [Caudoviricetes sp.]DAZ18835.1 MAG TPA: hypothetical protein [Caudoviricetes sp.]
MMVHRYAFSPLMSRQKNKFLKKTAKSGSQI